ncbi:MAG: hypothetical protein EXQ86_08060 [Rhodospirillales bacterium]|nr:hypothetical protein [Rhodospirillales bacterium]
MPPKNNPLKLNGLQLRTLALLQELARHPETAKRDDASGDVAITGIPMGHGDHLHVGSLVVSARYASGFSNPAVWTALARKGLAKPGYPSAMTLTAAGAAYATGLTEKLAQPSDH